MDNVAEKTFISPRLICNNHKNNTKVIKEIEDNFSLCDSFDISVAFISESGISAIKQSLLNVVDKKIKGRIVTSTYLMFNEPKMFQILYDLFKNSSIQVRVYNTNAEGFHPKGYIFKNGDTRNIIIGSSNLTQDALSVNQEWNICLHGKEDEDVVKRIDQEFSEQWNDSVPLTEEWIDKYKTNYKPLIRYYAYKNNGENFEPNKMQVEALESLNNIRNQGKNKALLISATGTGKTFLSAFDVKFVNPKRMLYVVHRETIAKKSMESYAKVIKDKKLGMFTGNEKNTESEYLFSTINTISKDEYISQFKKDEFDYIVIDEVHRAGAKMYEKLLDYFTPKFLLGMSATPERTDDPKKIYEIFDYNIAYEIRLKQAMEFNLLCPFHYYGISDIIIDGKIIDDNSQFNKLTCIERVKHILNAIHTYGFYGNKPHGLIFVSRSEEAKELSKLFNENSNFKSIALTSDNSNEEDRRNAISLLEEKDTNKEYLDYIFTVDLFNEGVDIPCLNQIVMVRKTESSIIFIQQLGRGLRKNDEKEFVTVIDIIGNYDNNYMIPLALSGSLKYDKDELRKFVYERNLFLPGPSTVSFDEITKARIYKSIDSAKLNSMQIIKEEYQKLKARLGNKIPKLSDFDRYSSIDPLIIIKSKGSYHNFLKQYDDDYKVELTNIEEKYIKFVSCKFASGKRIHELELISIISENNENDIFNELRKNLFNKYGVIYDDKVTKTIVNQLTGNFAVGTGEKYRDVPFIEKNGEYYQTSCVYKQFSNNMVFVNMLKEVIEFGISRYLRDYSDRYMNNDLVLYQKYSYDDVFRLLNWEKAENCQNVGGYKYDKYSNTLPVFINYDKTNDKDFDYEDKFVNHNRINAISKTNRTVNSKDAQIISDAKQNGTKIHMFIRKDKDDKDAKEFYYLGLANKEGEFIPVENKNEFIIPYRLETSVREDIFSYITNDN